MEKNKYEIDNGGEKIDTLKTRFRKHILLFGMGIVIGYFALNGFIPAAIGMAIVGGVLYDLIKFVGEMMYYGVRVAIW